MNKDEKDKDNRRKRSIGGKESTNSNEKEKYHRSFEIANFLKC